MMFYMDKGFLDCAGKINVWIYVYGNYLYTFDVS